VLFVGLDVHNDSIAVSLAPSGSTEVRRYGVIGGSHDDVLKLLKKLSAAHPGVALQCCYEAGPRGYPLCRFIRAHGHGCILVALSKVPRKPGDRVKTDRRDAEQLARLYRAGELTAELGDLHRFESAGQLMNYLGLVPSEDTTSDERRQGGITKMGNGIARRALARSPPWIR